MFPENLYSQKESGFFQPSFSQGLLLNFGSDVTSDVLGMMSRDGRHVLMTEVYKSGWNVYTGRNFWMNSSSLMELYNGVAPGPFMIERIYMQPLAYLSLNLIIFQTQMYGTKKTSWVSFSVANRGHHVTWPSFTQVLHVAGLPPAIFALKCSTLLKNLYESHAHSSLALCFWFRREKRLRHPFTTPSSYLKITKTQPKQHLAPGGTQILKNKQSSIISSPKLFCLKHLSCACEITKNM